ncbi:hypothetical protein [Actinacidiphila sp. ITFR-21]|uniref:hypothetical protein n=1 Tax=Actinacidiphila sp. ITFR-21 TaxID=3075199 RepID=UPI00288A3062|nr:hypothetical protein [Streptomyces sp. ITFR-21]WNI14568.1 hypothetical protein RLT57_02785 [Streptomyces sp. ITFR-21]
MAKALSAAQRKAVTGSEPGTGRLSARPEVCTALVAAGLAVPHGRGGHHAYYLSSEGRRLRAELAATRAGSAAGVEPAPAAAPARGGFTADDGTGGAPPGGAARRAAEVATAWEGLRQIRAVLLDGVTDVPAPWERERPVHAVALALEAAGCPPARPDTAGYRVTPAVEPGMAEVTWSAPGPAPAALATCASLLGSCGWQCTQHRTREGRPFLVASPRR